VDDDNVTRLTDLIKDDRLKEPSDLVFSMALSQTIGEILDDLPERERRIIEMRYGIGGGAPMTLEETGKVLGITRERVRQIQEKTIGKLRLLRELTDYVEQP